MADSKPNAKNSTFPTTHWTVINALKQASTEERASLLSEFVVKYTPALRLHLIHGRGYRHEADLEDTIQGFLADKVVSKNILEYVRQDRGRLRDYLRRCLDNYVYEQHRSKASKAWSNRISWDDIDGDPSHGEHFEQVCPFDIGWARAVMTEAIVRTKDQFFHSKRQHVWDVFDLCIIRPLLMGIPPVPYEELAKDLGISKKAVQNRRVSAVRAFGKHLTEIIAEYVGNDEELINSEIAELDAIMRSENYHETADDISY